MNLADQAPSENVKGPPSRIETEVARRNVILAHLLRKAFQEEHPMVQSVRTRAEQDAEENREREQALRRNEAFLMARSIGRGSRAYDPVANPQGRNSVLPQQLPADLAKMLEYVKALRAGERVQPPTQIDPYQ